MHPKRYWLRGGIIGAVILFFLICYALFLVPEHNPSPDDSPIESVLQLVKTVPAMEFFFAECAYRSSAKEDSWYENNCPSYAEIESKAGKINIVMYTLAGFLLGSVFCVLYNKFKNKNS